MTQTISVSSLDDAHAAFDFTIDGEYFGSLVEVPARFQAVMRGALQKALATRADEISALAPGTKMRVSFDSRHANFSVAEDFSITWNGERYASYYLLPQQAKDALANHPTFPDLNNDGIPDLFQHRIPECDDDRRQLFRRAVRLNRDAQLAAAAKADTFAPEFPGYELASFAFTFDGAEYESLAAVPDPHQPRARRLVAEFLRLRTENGGGPLDAQTYRLFEEGVASPPPTALPDATERKVSNGDAEPAVPEPELAGDLEGVVERLQASNERALAEEQESFPPPGSAIVASPIEESDAGRLAAIVLGVAVVLIVALIATIFVLLGAS